eukprot:6758679-Prymnesium_polylepis.1
MKPNLPRCDSSKLATCPARHRCCCRRRTQEDVARACGRRRTRAHAPPAAIEPALPDAGTSGAPPCCGALTGRTDRPTQAED